MDPCVEIFSAGAAGEWDAVWITECLISVRQQSRQLLLRQLARRLYLTLWQKAYNVFSVMFENITSRIPDRGSSGLSRVHSKRFRKYIRLWIHSQDPSRFQWLRVTPPAFDYDIIRMIVDYFTVPVRSKIGRRFPPGCVETQISLYAGLALSISSEIVPARSELLRNNAALFLSNSESAGTISDGMESAKPAYREIWVSTHPGGTFFQFCYGPSTVRVERKSDFQGAIPQKVS